MTLVNKFPPLLASSLLCMTTKQRKPPEVVNIIPAREVLRQGLAPFTHIEVKQDSKGAWHVFYPDPGFIPCAPACRLRERDRNHKHTYEQQWIQSSYTPTSYEDALDWGTLLAEGREVKVEAYKTRAERNAEKRLTEEA